MKESNRVVRRNPDNTYEVEGTLVIENFTRADECLYNCEAVTKCKRQLSPIFDVKVGTGVDCNKTCGIGGVCQNNVCNCKANVEGPNCDRCKRGYHSLRKDHPDGCVPCFCSDRSNACENAGLFFEEKQVTPIDASSVRLMGWGLYGVYEESTSHEKLTVESGPEISIAPTGDSSGALRDDDDSYVFLTSLSGKRLAAYGGKVSFTVRANVRMDLGLRADTAFPIFGIKGWRGQTLVYWDRTTRRAPETRYSVTLDEQNLRAIDGSPVTRQDVMTALTDLRGVFFRVYQFQGQQNVRLFDIKYQEATATSGSDPAPVERCTLCPDPYQGAFCEECKTAGDYHKIIDYNSTVNRWKCVPCKEGYQNSPACDKCEEGYADKILGRPSSEKPDCEEYVVPIVEPETLNIPSGRTVVLNCKIRRQKPGYNGTAWLLEWQDSDGGRITDTPRVFQVRDENSARLVIKDATPADTGRYRCEGYNRRSGSAVAFSNLTVESSSIKRVVLRSNPIDPDTTAIQCSVVAKEPSRPAQFRATLTRLPFPVGRLSERFESVKLQVKGANFTGTVYYRMKNDNDTGFWNCHVSDMINNYTVSRQTPVVLKPQQAFIWDLNTPVKKVEQPVGSAVRLKCNKIVRSPNAVTIPIVWTFKPANRKATSLFASPLGAPDQPNYSIMDESLADSLPPGVSRDGDDLVLNPLSVEHWGKFSCQRKPDSTRSSGRSVGSDSYESKKADVEVVPQMVGTRNINLNEGESVTLNCFPETNNLDEDGLPCQRYSWVYKSQKSARQLLGRRIAPKMIQLFSETRPTLNITKAEHTNSGIYYCRCHTFYRPGREVQSSKVMEYNVFISAVEEKPPNPKYEVAERTFVNGKRQWFYCYDVDAIPTARVWWEVWDKNATTIPGITLVDEGVIGNRSYSNITFVMDKHEHQLPFTCNAKNDVGHKTKIINMRYESTDYDPLRLKIIVQNTYNMMYKVQNDSHDVTDIVYSPMGQFGMADDGYKDPGVYIFCHMTGNPYGTELELVHNNPMSSSDVPDLIKQCNKMQVMANIVFCPLGKYEQYADFKWQCRAKQANPNTGKITTYTKKLDFVKVPSKIKIRLQYYNKWYGYDERDLRFYMLRGGVAVIRCDAGYYEGGRLSEIPYPHRYEFYILGQDGLPHYASPAGNTLTLTDIPETLDNKEIICFVRPQNDSDIATKGIGQRYFKVTVFTMPEKPSILVTMKDSMDPSLIIRNPDTIELRRNGPAVELTCTLQNYDTGVDRTFGRTDISTGSSARTTNASTPRESPAPLLKCRPCRKAWRATRLP
ncbi:hypothetical protein BOX15_Mlig028090g1 [Macrostomum lignano]|uniref:Soluble interferon alpha/beta receptor OPG204 n=1 Tax=Macrostomum lignano TaxID=282301 RepID=A0A267GWF8_9PLAT|nr:hypothetical protein BOX15_Mlig028090g1 [Macrostomum lignano]